MAELFDIDSNGSFDSEPFEPFPDKADETLWDSKIED
jgi:hypothetical protein